MVCALHVAVRLDFGGLDLDFGFGFWILQSQGHSVTWWFGSAMYCAFCFLVVYVSVDAVT